MYCSKCGTQVASEASFCAQCGSPLATGVAPLAFATSRRERTGSVAQNSPSGVGGWLGFLVLGLTALGPALGASQKYQAFSMAEFNSPQLATYAPYISYKTESWVIFIIGAAISIAAGFLLYFRHQPSSVRFAVIALWLIFPVRQAMYLFAANGSFSPQIADTITQDMGVWIIGSVIAAGIWTAYLLMSKRVKNTYHS
jgi:hypothetical protein